jgi:hypothetical protein
MHAPVHAPGTEDRRSRAATRLASDNAVPSRATETRDDHGSAARVGPRAQVPDAHARAVTAGRA